MLVKMEDTTVVDPYSLPDSIAALPYQTLTLTQQGQQRQTIDVLLSHACTVESKTDMLAYARGTRPSPTHTSTCAFAASGNKDVFQVCSSAMAVDASATLCQA